MVKQQHLDPRDYEAAPAPEEVDTEPTDHRFVLAEGEEKLPPAPLITAEEQERRDLQRRFKKVRGYKPTIKDLEKLRRMVEEVEQQAGLKRDGII